RRPSQISSYIVVGAKPCSEKNRSGPRRSYSWNARTTSALVTLSHAVDCVIWFLPCSAVFHVTHRAMAHVHVHEGHQLGRHDDERSHHVVVFVLEDVAVVHVAPAEDLEADDDVDRLVRI